MLDSPPPGPPSASAPATVSASVSAVHPVPPPPSKAADQVSAALALGRQMTQLYVAVTEHRSPPAATGRRSLREPLDAIAGLGPLDDEGLFRLRLLAVQAALHRISGVATDAGLNMPTADDLVAQESTLTGETGCQAVTTLHQQLIEVLGAAAPIMGTGYELGSALAALCEATRQDASHFADAVNHGRIDRIRELLERLRSLLPPHSAQAVRGGLNNWEEWLAAGKIGGQPILWTRDGPTIAAALSGQGALWFSLLTGQRAAMDVLSVDNYVDAGEALLRQYRDLGKRFFLQWWPYVALGTAAAVVIIVLILVFGHGAVRGVGTIATLLATVGITAKTAMSTLDKTVATVENSLWQAELDNAIVYAATALPAGTPPVAQLVTRPGQVKQRQAADNARQARHQAMSARATARTEATTTARATATATAAPTQAAPATPHEGR